MRRGTAPQITLTRLDGSPIDSDTFRNKVVLLDFFATWCAPCLAELPKLLTLRHELSGSPDITILIVSDGSDSIESIRRFARAKGTEQAFAYDKRGQLHKAFGFSGLPALVVIDRSGRLRMTHEGYNGADTGFLDRLRDFLLTI